MASNAQGTRTTELGEQAPLLDELRPSPATVPDGHGRPGPDISWRFVPLSLIASLGMAATVATTIYAYEKLVCDDPEHCRPDKQKEFSAVVAVANGIAHVVAIFTIGPLERLGRRRLRAGLILWLLFRSASVVVLMAGVATKSITIAVAGRLFEGVASDNLLHFSLNTIYVSHHSRSRLSLIMGVSLGLYMVGMAVSPVSMRWLDSWTTSFIVALGLFAFGFLYLMVAVPSSRKSSSSANTSSLRERPSPSQQSLSWWSFFSPIELFRAQPRTLLHGISLFIYTAVQAHLFPAIMVFSALRFHFDNNNIALIVSEAAAVALLHLILALVIAPLCVRGFKALRGAATQDATHSSHHRSHSTFLSRDFISISAAYTVQIGALVALSHVTTPPQLFAAIALLSAGLTVPSFFKSQFVYLVRQEKSKPGNDEAEPNDDNARSAMSVLTTMESIGGIASPFILGAVQAKMGGDSPLVFYTAALLMGISFVLFLIGTVVLRSKHDNLLSGI